MPQGRTKIEIPVEIINNLVVVPITVNKFLPLKFILDTGVETAILTDPDYAAFLEVNYLRKIVISGAGVQDSVNALVGQGLTYELPGGIVGQNMNLLILDDDYLKLEERMGHKIHGIIGYDLFKRFAIEINYDEKILTLYKRGAFKPMKRMEPLDLEIVGSRPFLKVKLHNEVSDSAKLMIDTGASHAILLDATQTTVTQPEKTIQTFLGAGLGGEIPGRIGRLKQVNMSEFLFKDIIVSIPEPHGYSQAIKRGSRQGTMGGELLSRMNPVFDYYNSKLYLSRGAQYKKYFEYDMSGLSLIVRGTFLDTLIIESVRPDSPAEDVDIRAGDVVLTINGLNIQMANLNRFNALLRKRQGQKVRIKILREGVKMKKILKLKRAI